MKTIFKILKQFITIPLQIVGAIIMAISITVFGLATLIDSPSMFMVKVRVILASIKSMKEDAKFERLKQKFNKQTDGTF